MMEEITDKIKMQCWNFLGIEKRQGVNHSSLQEALINSEFILCSYGYKLSLCLPTLVFECDSLSKNDKTHKKKKWKSDIMGGRYSRRLDWQVGICQLVEILDFLLYCGYMLTWRCWLHAHENLSFACVFKHCGLKTRDFKLLKCNQQWKRTHFAICVHCLRDRFWVLSERRLFLPLYRPRAVKWTVKYTCVCKNAHLCKYPHKHIN